MVISQADPLLEAVTASIGRDIPHAVSARCDDREIRDRFNRATTKEKRFAALREFERCIRGELAYVREVNRQESAEIGLEGAPISTGEQARPGREGSASVREESQAVGVALSEYEQDHAWAFSLTVASMADVFYSQHIRRFREKKLGGRLVSAGSDDAEAWSRLPENQALIRELSREGEWLAQVVPAWTADEAAFYIITGYPPPIPPVRGSFSRARLAFDIVERGVVTIEVEPWVSEKTVARLYRDVRTRVLLQHNARRRGMAVWRFVESLHTEPRPTLRDVWGGLVAQAKAKRPSRSVPLREAWCLWQAAHPELESLTLTECWQRWNEKHAGDATRQFRHFTRFRAALLSGIEHGTTINWPGYQTLAEFSAIHATTTPIYTPKPLDSRGRR